MTPHIITTPTGEVALVLNRILIMDGDAADDSAKLVHQTGERLAAALGKSPIVVNHTPTTAEWEWQDLIKVINSTSAPTVCGKCGSMLIGGMCRDETCPYSDWPQQVSVEDMESLAPDDSPDCFLAERIGLGIFFAGNPTQCAVGDLSLQTENRLTHRNKLFGLDQPFAIDLAHDKLTVPIDIQMFDLRFDSRVEHRHQRSVFGLVVCAVSNVFADLDALPSLSFQDAADTAFARICCFGCAVEPPLPTVAHRSPFPVAMSFADRFAPPDRSALSFFTPRFCL